MPSIARASPSPREAAVEFNDEIMEAIAYYAYEASSDLAAERGTYSSYKGSKWDRGLLPPDTVDLLEQERGMPDRSPARRQDGLDAAPREDRQAGHAQQQRPRHRPHRHDLEHHGQHPVHRAELQEPLRQEQPRRRLHRCSIEHLVRDLKARGLWNQDMLDQLKYFDGELGDIDEIPPDLKRSYLTAFGIDYHWIIDAAARRQKWIDQSQSVNLFLATPDMKTLSHMYRPAWHNGLKTTYYLRTLQASNIEKASLQVQKEMRGIVGRTRRRPRPAGPRHARPERNHCQHDPDLAKHAFTEAEKTVCSIEAMMNGGRCEACE